MRFSATNIVTGPLKYDICPQTLHLNLLIQAPLYHTVMVQLIQDILISKLALKKITKSTAHLLTMTGICLEYFPAPNRMLTSYIFLTCFLMELRHRNHHNIELFLNSLAQLSIVFFFLKRDPCE